MAYDPTIYLGCAAHYLRGRPPYSRALPATLENELQLDGSGRFLDVGCGPGTLVFDLAAHFEEALGIDPDADMLAEAAREGAQRCLNHVGWVRACAEDLARMDLGQFKLVTFGQSFHWTDRERVADAVYDLLVPGGAMVLIAHEREGRPQPKGPGHPEVPHEAVRAVVDRFLGARRRAGHGYSRRHADRYEDALARTRFGVPQTIFCPGRNDIVRDADGVLAGCFSTSSAAPHLFEERLSEFAVAVRAELAKHSPSGLFWDWPGDTGLVIARKSD